MIVLERLKIANIVLLASLYSYHYSYPIIEITESISVISQMKVGELENMHLDKLDCG